MTPSRLAHPLSALALSLCASLACAQSAPAFAKPAMPLGAPSQGEACKAFGAQAVGGTLQAARELLARHRVPFRIVKEDGKESAMTMDYSDGRLNLEVEKGKVTATRCG